MISLGTMPLLNDYSLCQQSVTVYHFDGTTLTRTVYSKAYLDSKKTESVDRTGSSEANGFLLVIPRCTENLEPTVCVGDKVMYGEGPSPVEGEDVSQWWRSLIPTKVAGLHVVRYVDPKYWAGEVCHVEAGG